MIKKIKKKRKQKNTKRKGFLKNDMETEFFVFASFFCRSGRVNKSLNFDSHAIQHKFLRSWYCTLKYSRQAATISNNIRTTLSPVFKKPFVVTICYLLLLLLLFYFSKTFPKSFSFFEANQNCV